MQKATIKEPGCENRYFSNHNSSRADIRTYTCYCLLLYRSRYKAIKLSELLTNEKCRIQVRLRGKGEKDKKQKNLDFLRHRSWGLCSLVCAGFKFYRAVVILI